MQDSLVKEDFAALVNGVIHRTPDGQEKFLGSLPTILPSLPPKILNKGLLQFFIDWFSFDNLQIAKSLISTIKYFFDIEGAEIDLNLLMQYIKKALYANAIFLQHEIIELTQLMLTIFSPETLDKKIIPEVDKIINKENIDNSSVIICFQAYLANEVSDKTKNEIINNMSSILKIAKSHFVHLSLLKNIVYFDRIAADKSVLINDLIIPCLSNEDFKVRCMAISSLSLVSEDFMNYCSNYTPLINLASDKNWHVRYSFARTIWSVIQYAEKEQRISKCLLTLCSDTITEVKSAALESLAKCCPYVHENVLEIIPTIFDKSMRSPSTEVRIRGIQLWGSLLAAHPDAPFQAQLNKSLCLLKSVTVFDFVYQTLYYVVPHLKPGLISLEDVQKSFDTLFDNKDKPNKLIDAINVATVYVNDSHLKDYCPYLVTKVKPLLRSPVYAVRCEAGNFFIDGTANFGWEWAKEYFIDEFLDMLKSGNIPLKTTAMRTAAALLCIKPADDIQEEISEIMNDLSESDSNIIKLNTEMCLHQLQQRDS